jgi:hypothetical protein
VTAKVYKIIEGKVKFSNKGNPYIEYSVNDANGNKASIIYTDIPEPISAQTIRVILNDPHNPPISILDGSSNKVF